MRNAGGYAFIVSPTPDKVRLDGGRAEPVCEGVTEYDTYSCKHCGSIRHVRPRQRPEDIGGLCKQCMGLICPYCVDEGRCTPLEKRIQEAEERDYRRRQWGS